MAAVSVGSGVLEIGHLLTSTNRGWMTLLPVGFGAVVVAFMLLGAGYRQIRNHRSFPHETCIAAHPAVL